MRQCQCHLRLTALLQDDAPLIGAWRFPNMAIGESCWPLRSFEEDKVCCILQDVYDEKQRGSALPAMPITTRTRRRPWSALAVDRDPSPAPRRGVSKTAMWLLRGASSIAPLGQERVWTAERSKLAQKRDLRSTKHGFSNLCLFPSLLGGVSRR